jgi:hypothetical protein
MIHVKVVSRKGGGYLFESEGLSWDPIAGSGDAKDLDVLRLYNDDAPPGSLVGVWIGPDNRNDFIFDVNKYDVYVLGEDGKTIDRIP